MAIDTVSTIDTVSAIDTMAIDTVSTFGTVDTIELQFLHAITQNLQALSFPRNQLSASTNSLTQTIKGRDSHFPGYACVGYRLAIF